MGDLLEEEKEGQKGGQKRYRESSREVDNDKSLRTRVKEQKVKEMIVGYDSPFIREYSKCAQGVLLVTTAE